VLVTAVEDRAQQRLTRRITSFRKFGDGHRRGDEVHELRLFRRSELAAALRGIEFRVRALTGYGAERFRPGVAGFLARKPPARVPRGA
jgi:hypothetical protein